jgi:hypothetical protein
VRTRFGLPATARIGAFLVFGYPTDSLRGRAFNVGARWLVGATNKLPAERLFFHETFDNPIMPPTELAQLVEAARHAPSATNAQPWRFLWRTGVLYIFVQRNNPRYGEGPGAEYRFFDGGICMGNVTLALEVLEMAGRWQLLASRRCLSGLLADRGAEPPDHPPDLQPLARLLFEKASV